MRGTAYYTEPEYHRYLLSNARQELFPAREWLAQIRWNGVSHLLDFGMGNGYFLPFFAESLGKEASIWGAECQEELIDVALQTKVRERLERFIPFYVERTEHPLIPDWIPQMDLIFCSCVLSTFADPVLAIHGIGRALEKEGRIVILDWEKKEAPSGPDVDQKISKERMLYFVEDAGYRVRQVLRTNPYVYGLEIVPGEDAAQRGQAQAAAARATDLE